MIEFFHVGCDATSMKAWILRESGAVTSGKQLDETLCDYEVKDELR